MENLILSIGIGLGVSLLFAEFFGLAAGGMIVPGYFALYLHKPGAVLFTLGAAFATYLIVRLLSSAMIIYGKRRTVLMILTGYLIGLALPRLLPGVPFFPGEGDSRVIGYIIPGLIAIWLDRQGIVETLSTLAVASAAVRLVLILILGDIAV